MLFNCKKIHKSRNSKVKANYKDKYKRKEFREPSSLKIQEQKFKINKNQKEESQMCKQIKPKIPKKKRRC